MKGIALTGPGTLEPLGVTPDGNGVNVSVYSATATSLYFCAFDKRGKKEVARIPLQRTGDVFHGHIAGLGPGARYGLRADGPDDPHIGQVFDPAKLLLDPYARLIDRPFEWHDRLAEPRSAAIDTADLVPKAIVTGPPPPLKTRRPKVDPSRRVIYEVGVKAFTKLHPTIPREIRGTLPALAHPAAIEHFVRLGITTVELMPIVAWIDEHHLPPLGLANVWGYNPVGFFALDPRLAPNGLPDLCAVTDGLHDAGIEIVLDVVLNHTGECDEFGATLSLAGLDNPTYYRLDPSDSSRYVNDTGTGNTVALDRPPVTRLALDALRYFAEAGGIDGFRFDLATVLGRTDEGFDRNAPLLAAIAGDPILKDLILIAEPWDVGFDGYRLGAFPNGWSEWNDRFRDDVRRYWRSDDRAVGELATRLAGSSDVFEGSGRSPTASINFVAAHDGFTLADLVSYSRKHNEANGEGNRDGADANFSWNRGVEGPTDDREIVAERAADVRALLATLFLARGTPMLTAGDELGRSQGGNNNAYAQDNEFTWLDWDNADRDLTAFVATLIRLRRTYPVLAADRFLAGRPIDATGIPDVVWYDAEGNVMTTETWERAEERVLGMALYGGEDSDRILAWFNSGFTDAGVALPTPRVRRHWKALLHTRPGDEPASLGGRFTLPQRTILVLAEVED